MAQKVECADGRMRFLLKVGDLSERKERKEGRWRIARYLGKKMLYIGCPHCNNIIELRTNTVNPDGIIRGTIACPDCGDYSIVKLESWDEYLEDCREKGENA